MSSYFDVFVPTLFFLSAFGALFGTNQQANLSRWRMLNDPDDAVASAARLYRAGWSFLFPRYKARIRAAEAAIPANSEAWHRYDIIRRELRAWNSIETSVAVAAVASLLTMIGALVERAA